MAHPSTLLPLSRYHAGDYAASLFILLIVSLSLSTPHVLDFKKHFSFYASYHDNATNKFIHLICIWPILYTAFLFLSYAQPIVPVNAWGSFFLCEAECESVSVPGSVAAIYGCGGSGLVGSEGCMPREDDDGGVKYWTYS